MCHKRLYSCRILPFKGTVSEISIDPPCKDDNARFTSLIAFFDQVLLDVHVFVYLSVYFHFWFLRKSYIFHKFYQIKV